eukprot:700335-Rhodomonas_salina.4
MPGHPRYLPTRMPGTDLASGLVLSAYARATHARAGYAMPGTDVAYGATRRATLAPTSATFSARRYAQAAARLNQV